MFEGSGGATALIGGYENNITRGGTGGGVVWISAANRARFERGSNVRADGGYGYKLRDVNVTDTVIPGSGGGSGGSIQILTTNLDGDGFITAKGGNGSIGGGGGGSGGRVVLYFLGNYLADFWNQHTFNWTGSLNI